MARITTRITVKTGAIVLVAAVSLFVLGAGIYRTNPSLGFSLLATASVILILLFLILGIATLLNNPVAFKAALLGLTIAILLGGLAFFENKAGINLGGLQEVYLILCPPFIAAMALDNTSVLGTLTGWSFITLGNAVIYALVAALLQWFWRYIRRISSQNRTRQC